MDVLVIRHAAALERDEAKTRGMLDRDRPLTKQGRSRMRRAARGLRVCSPDVWALFTSPFCRAVETAEVLLEQYKAIRLTQTPALLPDAEPEELAQLLAEGAIQSPVAVVGHEPHLSRWVSWCLSGDARSSLQLRKGGACLLRFEGAPGPGGGRLLWLLTPAVLRRL